MATQMIQSRLKQTTEKRAKLKEDKLNFDLALCSFIGNFNKAEDDLPLTLRAVFHKLKATAHCKDIIKNILGEKSEKAKPPTEEEKLQNMGTKAMQYSRCKCCETPIQNRLMKLHMGRAICQNTATTRLHDVKLWKDDKKTENPRVQIKERITQIAKKSGLSEDEIKELIKEDKSKVVILQEKIDTELKKRGMTTDESEPEDEAEPEKKEKIDDEWSENALGRSWRDETGGFKHFRETEAIDDEPEPETASPEKAKIITIKIKKPLTIKKKKLIFTDQK